MDTTNVNEKSQSTSSIVSLQRLKELLSYDPITGDFFWLIGKRSGTKAGHLDDSKGYIIMSIGAQHYYGHVLAWFYTYGVWTKVDHKDRIGIHNWLSNLREATSTQNNRNQGLRIDNMLGVKGVTKIGSKYIARIFVDGSRIYLGSYATLEEAIAVRTEAANKYFGEFANG